MDRTIRQLIEDIHEMDGVGRNGIQTLAPYGLLSKRQIAKVVGVSHTVVNREIPDYQGPSIRIFHADPRDGIRTTVSPEIVGSYGDGAQREKFRKGLPQ